MPNIGHITLDGREYVVTDPKQVTRQSANQVAAKIGSSAGDYDDLEGWSAWVMDDWRAGVGQRDAEANGFLFSSAETRFDGQILTNQRQFPGNHTSEGVSGLDQLYDIGSGKPNTQLASKFTVPATTTFRSAHVLLPAYLYHGSATRAHIDIYSDTAGRPNAALRTNTVDLIEDHGYYWMHVTFSPITTGGAPTDYHVVVYPDANNPMRVPVNFASSSDGSAYNGATWSAGPSPCCALGTGVPNAAVSFIASFNNQVYYAVTTTLYKLPTTAGNQATQVKNYATNITDLEVVGNNLLIGLGDTTNYEAMSTTEVFTARTVPARLLLLWNGYLYRAVLGTLSYTSDEVAWTSIEIRPTTLAGYTIRGIGGFNNEVIISTDDALLRLAAGDIVLTITRWPKPVPTNGQYMLNFQGNLYISLGPSILRFDGASILPFGPDLGEGLPYDYSGDIVGITACNNWMFCAVQGNTMDTVWCHNGQGWHHAIRFPVNDSLCALTYCDGFKGQAGQQKLVTGSTTGWLGWATIPDQAKSTFLVDTAQNLPLEVAGLIETSWFYGSLREVQKDFESVYADGEQLNNLYRFCEIYWQDEGSTDWETLGQIDNVTSEQRWSSTSTRPASRKIKIRVVLVSVNTNYSVELAGLRILAVRIKYRPMIIDRFQWNVPLMINEDQIFIDGGVQTTYSIAQQLTHIDGLLTQVPPFVYKDLDGKQYNVMVTGHSRQCVEFDYFNGAKQNQYAYTIQLEQTSAGSF